MCRSLLCYDRLYCQFTSFGRMKIRRYEDTLSCDKKYLLLLIANILKIISSVAQIKVLTLTLTLTLLPARHLALRIGPLKRRRKRRRLHLAATSPQSGLDQHMPSAIFRDTDSTRRQFLGSAKRSTENRLKIPRTAYSSMMLLPV
jgi:hypothetical protein